MLGTFFLLLFLWIFGRELSVHSTTAAFVGLAVLLVSGALTWNDILHETGAWNTLVWFAALVMMATNLNKLGLIPWVGETMGAAVGGIGWAAAFLILSLVYFYSHYLFASNTAHVSSMYAAFLAVAITVGTPPMLAALVLAFFSNLFSSMTHYGTGPAPVLFGSGYVEMGAWWKLGAIISVINILQCCPGKVAPTDGKSLPLNVLWPVLPGNDLKSRGRKWPPERSIPTRHNGG